MQLWTADKVTGSVGLLQAIAPVLYGEEDEGRLLMLGLLQIVLLSLVGLVGEKMRSAAVW